MEIPKARNQRVTDGLHRPVETGCRGAHNFHCQLRTYFASPFLNSVSSVANLVIHLQQQIEYQRR